MKVEEETEQLGLEGMHSGWGRQRIAPRAMEGRAGGSEGSGRERQALARHAVLAGSRTRTTCMHQALAEGAAG